MCVYLARLLTENDAYCPELRLMLRWIRVMSPRARFALGHIGEAVKTSMVVSVLC